MRDEYKCSRLQHLLPRSHCHSDESYDEEDVGDELLPGIGAVELEHLQKKVKNHDKAINIDEAAPPTESRARNSVGNDIGCKKKGLGTT